MDSLYSYGFFFGVKNKKTKNYILAKAKLMQSYLYCSLVKLSTLAFFVLPGQTKRVFENVVTIIFSKCFSFQNILK